MSALYWVALSVAAVVIGLPLLVVSLTFLYTMFSIRCDGRHE